MDRIMILGAGAAQVPLIRAARSMGYETVVSSIPGSYPGLSEGDICDYTDITDPEAIAASAEKYGVRAVATCCLETGLKALAYTCKKLGLPGISPEAAEISVNKLAMQRALKAAGVRSAPFCLLRSEDDLEGAAGEIGFPMVIKAVDLQGSRGIYVVHDMTSARSALKSSLSLTHTDYCIAEAFISGDNIGAEAFVQNGRVIFVLPDGTVSHRGSVNIPIGHYAPLDRPEPVLDRIRSEVEKAIRACGFDNCAVNADLVLHGDEPYIIELTARVGATCLPELVSIYYGVDYYRMILMAALGQDVSPLWESRSPVPTASASSMIAARGTGILRSISLPEVSDDVYDMHLIVEPGDAVRTFNDTIDRIGQIIITGTSAAGCLRRVEELIAAIRMEIDET